VHILGSCFSTNLHGHTATTSSEIAVDFIIPQIAAKLPVVPHKAVAEVSRDRKL
jgi:hypothetical protein